MANDEADASFYHAVIDVTGHQISGIMAVESGNNDRCRILFTTIAGPKLLDMYITETGYEKIYCIKQLNRKVILKFFQKDFAVATGLYRDKKNAIRKQLNDCVLEEIPIKKKDTIQYYLNHHDLIERAVYLAKKQKKLFEIFYTYQNEKVNSIEIQHFNFNMHIMLTRIENEPEVSTTVPN